MSLVRGDFLTVESILESIMKFISTNYDSMAIVQCLIDRGPASACPWPYNGLHILAAMTLKV